MIANRIRRYLIEAGRAFALLLVLAVVPGASAGAQEPVGASRVPLGPADTSSPRATLETFRSSVIEAIAVLMDAYRQNQEEPGIFRSREVSGKVTRAEALFARAVRTLDLSDVPPVNRSNRSLEAVLLLKEVLDRTPMPAPDAVPGRDSVGSDRGAVQGWTLPGTDLRITRMTGGPRSGEYLFSSETVGRLDEIYAGLRDLPEMPGQEDFYAFYTQSPGHLLPPKWYPFIEALPEPFREEIQGQAVWQWIGLGLLFALAFTGLFVTLRATRRMSKGTPARILIASVVPPALVALTATAVMYVADFEINVSGSVEATLNDLTEGTTFLSLVWGIVALSNALAQVIETSPGIRRDSIDASLTRAAIRTLGIALACAVLVNGASHLGLPLAGILAGLGVGGLAIALAAKPTIENFIGGLILFADRPVRVGDVCRFGDLQGQVEGIGIRSTRIRGLDRSLITVPNAVFVNLNLINLSNRDGMPYDRTVKIRTPGDADAIRAQIASIVSVVAKHPKVDPTSVRVRLQDSHEEEPRVEVRAVFTTRDWNEFLGIQQEVDLILRETLRHAAPPVTPHDNLTSA